MVLDSPLKTHLFDMLAAYERATLRLAHASRFAVGSVLAKRRGQTAPSPELILYEYEASPWCRRVRETLCVLGLRALIKPTPRETLRLEGAFSPAARHKAEVRKRGGRLLFPFLDDRTAGVALNESSDICQHLWEHYGADVTERPRAEQLLNGGSLPKPLGFAFLVAPSGLRPWPSNGLMAAPAREAADPLILHGNEADDGSRQVREALCSLQLAYFSVPLASEEHRPLPHLEDPNTGFKCFGSRQALRHLDETYREGPALGLGAPVPEPNVGDGDRTSWLTTALKFVPSRLI